MGAREQVLPPTYCRHGQDSKWNIAKNRIYAACSNV